MDIKEALFEKWESSPSRTRDEYINLLKHGVWLVEFTKACGTDTTMEVTLDPTLLPPLVEGTSRRTIPEHDNLVHVFSIDRGGWRSFKTETVKKFYKKPEA